MKKLIVLGFVLLSQISFADGGFPCQKIEYAQLKDSSKKELRSVYCSAIEKSELNKKLKDHANDFYMIQVKSGRNSKESEKDIMEKSEAQISCLQVADSASSMFSKKFNVKDIACSSN